MFVIDFFCALGSFDTVTSLCMGFHSERAAAGLGPSGLKNGSYLGVIGWLNPSARFFWREQ